MMGKASNRFMRGASKLRAGFTPISLPEYVKLHLRANPSTKQSELVARLRQAIEARRRGTLCQCGEPIWVIGSAEVGLRCFTCITGEAEPDHDYEIVDETAG